MISLDRYRFEIIFFNKKVKSPNKLEQWNSQEMKETFFLNMPDILKYFSKEKKNLIKLIIALKILNFIETTVQDNSDIASSSTIGNTIENRAIKRIVLKSPTSSKSIWIDCGIHAVRFKH